MRKTAYDGNAVDKININNKKALCVQNEYTEPYLWDSFISRLIISYVSDFQSASAVFADKCCSEINNQFSGAVFTYNVLLCPD